MSTPVRASSFNHSPLAPLAAAFALGIYAAAFAQVSYEISCAFGVVATVCGAWLLCRRRHTAALLVLLLAFACIGATLDGLERRNVGAERVRRMIDEGRLPSGSPVEVTGVVEGAAEPMPDGFALNLRVEKLRTGDAEQQASGRVRLFASVANLDALLAYEQLELRTGARLRVMTRLRRTEAFRNPGVISQIELLDRAGVDASGIIKSPLIIERLDDDLVFLPAWWLSAWRAKLLARTHETFEPHTAGLLGAMLLGHDRLLTREVGERFRFGGTYHVLVVSGMHVTIIGFIALFVAARLTKNRIALFVAPVLAIWAYACAVGAEISVVRAAVMFTFILLAPALGRPRSALNALAGAALLLLAWQPDALFHPSFQLTFLSVFAITVLAVPLLARLKETGEWRPSAATPYPPRCPGWWRALGEILFWNEQAWRAGLRREVWDYNLQKANGAQLLRKLRLQGVVRYSFAVVFVSACVQIVMLPLLVILFHRVSPIALGLNLIVGVMMAALTLCAVVALVLTELSATLAAPIVFVTELINRLMMHSVDPFITIETASFRVPSYVGRGAALYALYFLPLVVLLFALAHWRPVARTIEIRAIPRWSRLSLVTSVLLLIAFAVSIVMYPFGDGAGDGRLRVDFLDVGQGDAALVTLPDATTLLVDGGGQGRRRGERKGIMRLASDERQNTGDGSGAFDDADFNAEYDRRSIGEAVVSEYLWRRGLRRIDYVLATHRDADHIEGLNAAVRNFRPRAAFVGRTPRNDPEFSEFAHTLTAHGTSLHVLHAGDLMRFGAARIEVLHPPATGEFRGGNDESIVLRIVYGERRILLTGDIEAKAEQTLVRRADKHLAADVVKVAHHGSRTSSIEDFVRRTQAEVAVISVGRDSPFGHPHAEVVERWRSAGTRVLTTGERGTITISTDGEDLKVETFVGER